MKKLILPFLFAFSLAMVAPAATTIDEPQKTEKSEDKKCCKKEKADCAEKKECCKKKESCDKK